MSSRDHHGQGDGSKIFSFFPLFPNSVPEVLNTQARLLGHPRFLGQKLYLSRISHSYHFRMHLTDIQPPVPAFCGLRVSLVTTAHSATYMVAQMHWRICAHLPAGAMYTHPSSLAVQVGLLWGDVPHCPSQLPGRIKHHFHTVVADQKTFPLFVAFSFFLFPLLLHLHLLNVILPLESLSQGI